MKIRYWGAALAVALVLSLPLIVEGTALPALPDRSLAEIEATELRMHIEFLASEELGGRYTLSPQMGVVNRYLASRLRAYGFRGGADGSFFQEYRVRSVDPVAEESWLRFEGGQGPSERFEYGDFALQGDPLEFAAEVVFVGYGISAPEMGHDDYDSLDVEGKAVFALPGSPLELKDDDVRDKRGEEAAGRHGAALYMTLPPARFKNFVRSPRFKSFVLRQSRVELFREEEAPEPSRLTLNHKSGAPVLAALGIDFDSAYDLPEGFDTSPRALDLKVEGRVVMDVSVEPAANVIGILDGTDPRLKDQYLVLSAHQDHLKTRRDGAYFPGADDDGSGVSAVLEVAENFSRHPPRRSVAVIFHSGEENGLLGSEYNTEVAPAIALDSIVANINIDMIGRSKPPGDDSRQNRMLTGPNTVYVLGADRISPQLHEINERTNRDFQQLDFDYTLNDPGHPSRIYYRSDHWNYGRQGIPFLFFFSGTHEDYHRPSDTIDKLDWDKLTRVTRHIFAVSWRVANMDERIEAKDE